MVNKLVPMAAWVAVSGFGAMGFFQLMLALGLPWGRAAWGGKHRTLPTGPRVASFISLGIFIFGGLCVLERSGITEVFYQPLMVKITVWCLAGIFSLSTIGNILSASKIEKKIMTPIAIILAITCLIVAIGP